MTLKHVKFPTKLPKEKAASAVVPNSLPTTLAAWGNRKYKHNWTKTEGKVKWIKLEASWKKSKEEWLATVDKIPPFSIHEEEASAFFFSSSSPRIDGDDAVVKKVAMS
jgi:hypothetical protein